MVNFWLMVDKVIDRSDVVLEVLDARVPHESRNIELEERVKKKGKKLLYVLNKCDLASPALLEKAKKDLHPSVFVSSRKHLGTTILRNKILSMGSKDKVMVGVCGYPNTGKSSLINALSGRSKTKTSPESGFTKAIQLASAGRIMMIDTPGVVPHGDKDEVLLAMIGAKDASRVKDPDVPILRIMEIYPRKVSEFYNVPVSDPDTMLESIAKKSGRLFKGGEPDTEATARMMLRDWQTGKFLISDQ
jgi:ribosome biogenesis GTPase A